MALTAVECQIEEPFPVPTYQYTCTDCGEPLEAVQSFSDAALTECPACGGRLRKVFSAVGVVFKGSGFYKTDSRSGGNKEGGAGQDGGGKDGGAKDGAAKDGATGSGGGKDGGGKDGGGKDGGSKQPAASGGASSSGAGSSSSSSGASTPAAKTA